MSDTMTTIAVLVVLFGAVAIASYFVLRVVFMRAADRATRHVEDVLTRVMRSPQAASAGRFATNVVREAASRPASGWARYARAEGVDQAGAQREFQESIERLARLMDSYVKVPILGPVGLDAVLGLFPFVGDATSAVVSLSLVARSLKYGIPRELVVRMLANVLVDALLGAVPLVGDLADIWFRANTRNVALLREYLDRGR
ncbi:MAG: DUF4112 domain-containing protein [Vicinamibacterales bacterium]